MARRKNVLSLAVGTAFAATVAGAPLATAADNPFQLESLKSGYQVADGHKGGDGKCGEGKCGGDKKDKEGKGGKGKCEGET